MTALDSAIDAAQNGAIKALGKRFVRGTDEPELDDYRSEFSMLGFTDERGVEIVLNGWRVLREEREQPPAEPVASRAAATETEPASDRQWTFLRTLADEKGFAAPTGPLSKAQASEVISALQGGTYDPDKWSVPF